MSRFTTKQKQKKYILMKSLLFGNKFIVQNDPDKPESEKVKSDTGEIAYQILGYADTIEIGQHKLCGIREELAKNLKLIDKSHYSLIKKYVDNLTSESKVDSIKFFEMAGILKEILR